jgi:hypothetical protein
VRTGAPFAEESTVDDEETGSFVEGPSVAVTFGAGGFGAGETSVAAPVAVFGAGVEELVSTLETGVGAPEEDVSTFDAEAPVAEASPFGAAAPDVPVDSAIGVVTGGGVGLGSCVVLVSSLLPVLAGSVWLPSKGVAVPG